MDRLFREKADQYEVQPGAGAWEAINGQITSEPKAFPLIWKVAAMLVVLMTAVVILFKLQSPSASGNVVIADHPVPFGTEFHWELPNQIASQVAIDQAEPINNGSQPPVTPLVIDDEYFGTQMVNSQRPVITIESRAIAFELPEIPEPTFSVEVPER